jgi:hypothetical protein
VTKRQHSSNRISTAACRTSRHEKQANGKWKRPSNGRSAFAGFVDVMESLAQSTKDSEKLRVFAADVESAQQSKRRTRPIRASPPQMELPITGTKP